MKKVLVFILAFIMCISTCSCASIYDRTYTSVSKHQEQAASEEDASILRAENYSSLVSAVQHFVSWGQESGTIHLYQYSGDIAGDLEDASNEILTKDPLGSYALTNITYEYSRIVSYYECTFTFEYKHTVADMASIIVAYGTGTIRDLIQASLSSFSPVLTIQTSDYYSNRSDLLNLVHEAYYASPETAFGYPDVSVTIYPEEGTTHIVELNFTYSASQETLLSYSEQVENMVTQLTAQLDTLNDTSSWLLYSRLADIISYNPNAISSVYRVFSKNPANSEAIALAYQLLCNRIGLECAVVSGTLNGNPHCWNIITYDNISWHLDLTRNETENAYLHNDEVFSQLGYSWSQDDFNSCSGKDLTLAGSVQNETEDQDSGSETDSVFSVETTPTTEDEPIQIE